MDIENIKTLTQLMVDNGLTEVIIRNGDDRVILRRGGVTGGVPMMAPPAHVQMVPMPMPQGAPAAAIALPTAAPVDAANVKTITSPMVGTFYASPDPDSPPFIKVGDTLGKDTVVCIIEAMKVFNEIKADIAGKVVSIEVQNGQPVEFGQVLVKVQVP